MQKELEHNCVLHTKDLWSQVLKSGLEISVVNMPENIDKNLNICVVLCPLYEMGSLKDAGLIEFPMKINDSRVSGKFDSYLKILSSLSKLSSNINGTMKLNAILANKGVILQRNPTIKDIKAIDYHGKLYQESLQKFCEDNKVELNFSNYHEMKVDFPTFVDLDSPIPNSLPKNGENKNEEEYTIIESLNEYFGLNIQTNKKNRHVVKRILSLESVTANNVFWLIAGYLAFDNKIAEIVGDNGIYITSEKLEPLFGIAKFTESLSNLTRIQTKA